MTRDLVYVDLDGTFITRNSFHLWLKFLVFGSLSTPLLLRYRVLKWTFCRLSRRMSHAEWKRRVLIDLARLPQELQKKINTVFSLSLEQYVSPRVSAYVQEALKRGTPCVMATAAPEIYARPLSERHGFNDVLATPMVGVAAEWKENLRDVKAQSIRDHALRMGHDASDFVIVTDHLDDLPAMTLAREILWCGSDADYRLLEEKFGLTKKLARL